MRIPNQKRKYSDHNIRIERYLGLIRSTYDRCNFEAAKIALSTSCDVGEVFSFSNFPQTKARILKVQSLMSNDLYSIIINGISAEWGESDLSQDQFTKSVLNAFGADFKDKKYERYFKNNSEALTEFSKRKDRGLNLSQKVWNMSQDYKNGLEAAISVSLNKGASAIELSKQVSKYLRDFPSLKKEYTERFGQASNLQDCEYRSARLARTEINMAYRTAESVRWNQMDFVVGKEVKRSGRAYACNTCSSLEGKYPKNFQFVGWHPSCMCYVIPILKTEDEFWDWDGRGIAPSESKNEIREIPRNFKDWISDNADRISKAKCNGTLPYFLRDNSVLK